MDPISLGIFGAIPDAANDCFIQESRGILLLCLNPTRLNLSPSPLPPVLGNAEPELHFRPQLSELRRGNAVRVSAHKLIPCMFPIESITLCIDRRLESTSPDSAMFE
jgi:hypothetical protein